MEDKKQRPITSSIRETATALIGLSFLWSVFRGNFFGSLVMYGMADAHAEAFYYGLFLAGVCIAPLLLLSSKTLDTIRRLSAKRWFPIALALLTASGCTTLAHCTQGRLFYPYLLPFGGLCAGLGLFGTVPIWAEYLVGKLRKSIFTLVLLSMTLSCVIGLAAALAPQPNPYWLTALTALVPGLAYALLPASRTGHDFEPGETDRDFALVAGHPLPTIVSLALFLVIGAAGKGVEFHQGTLGFDDTFVAIVTLFILMFVMLSAAALRRFHGARLMVGFLWLALVAVYVAGALLLLISLDIPLVDCVIVAARYALFFFLVLLLVLYIRVDPSRRRVAFLIFIGAQIASAFITYCAVPLLIDVAGVRPQVIAVVALISLLVPVTLVMVTILKTLAAPTQPAASAPLRGEPLVAACERISNEYDLTSREREVLALLYEMSTDQDDAIQAIADRLVISKNTVRVHKNHIYKKMDVHSRSELANRVEQAAPKG